MNLLEVLVISVGLSLDVFAYVIYKGAMLSKIKKSNLIKLCVIFGGWQVGAILFGNLITEIPIIENTHIRMAYFWQIISALIFAGIGIYMLIRSVRKENVFEHKEDDFNFEKVILWACITSIDAFFAGIGFGFLNTELLLMCAEVGIITIVNVVAGLYFGYRLGCESKNRALTLGGVILIIGSIEVLLRHAV